MKKATILFISIIFLSTFLRLYRLGENPPSLYWDETSLGYNAFAIATSGMDEHGERLPRARFIAFGDYKPPGYVYIAALAIKTFGLSEFTIRLPSALAGVGIVIIAYLFCSLFFESVTIGLLAALIIAVSPWSIQLSRAAFEANLGAFFNICGLYLFIKAVKKNPWYFLLSTVFFMLSFYTFNANRITGPIVFAALSLFYVRTIWNYKRAYIVAIIIGGILLIPSIPYLLSAESKLRFNEVTIFTDLNTVEVANKRIEREGNAIWAKILHNRRVGFTQLYLSHFIDQFNPRYLFYQGDRNPRLSVQVVGELYFFELPFLIIGLYAIFRRKKELFITLILWIIAAIIPSATARETPHALRTASLLPVYQIAVGYGMYIIWRRILRLRLGQRRVIVVLAFFIMIASWYYYLHYYFIHYGADWANEWQDGYKEMIETVSKIQNNYDYIVVTSQEGRPYIYFLLYEQINPRTYLAERRARRDWWGLWTVDGFGKYYFDEKQRFKLKGKILFVASPGQITEEDHPIKRIYSKKGEEVFVISER